MYIVGGLADAALGGPLFGHLATSDMDLTETSIDSTRTAVLTHINAGAGTVNRSAGGNALIEGSVVSGAVVNPLTAGGSITAVAAVDSRHVENSVFTSSALWQSTNSTGSIEQTLHMPQIHGTVPDGLSAYQGAGGVSVQLPAGSSVRTAIETLAQQPGNEYLVALGNRSDVDWGRVEALNQSLDFSRSGLTPEATIAVIVVVSILTYGAASSVGGAAATSAGLTTTSASGAVVLTSTGTAVAAGVTAGVTSLASTAAVSLINNQGDIGAVLNELGSSENAQGLLLTMATAGLTQGILGAIDVPGGGTLASVNANSSVELLLARNAVQGISSAVLESAVMGTDLEDAIRSNLQGALINTVAAQGADAIGDAQLDTTSAAIAHALLGCAVGAANAGNGSGCAPGAAGAAIGELVANWYGNSQNLGGLEAQLDKDPTNTALAQQISQIQHTVTELARLTGAGGALLIGGDAADMQITMTTGSNAAVNNYLNHTRPSLPGLSEVEQYDRAVQECGPQNPSACALRDSLAQLSADRDQQLRNACSGPSASQASCNALAQQASLMGNVVTGSYGGLVYANSINGAIGLNTATVGPVTRPDNFHDQAAQSTAEGFPLAIGGQGISIVRLAGTGFVLGAGFDGAGQYLLNGEFRPVQNLVAGLTGSVGLPFASRGNLWAPLTGAGVAAANTTFNNIYYHENTNTWYAAGLGGFAGAVGPYAGVVSTGLLSRITGNTMPRIPIYGPTPTFPSHSFPSTIPNNFGAAVGNLTGNSNNFFPLSNGIQQEK